MASISIYRLDNGERVIDDSVVPFNTELRAVIDGVTPGSAVQVYERRALVKPVGTWATTELMVVQTDMAGHGEAVWNPTERDRGAHKLSIDIFWDGSPRLSENPDNRVVFWQAGDPWIASASPWVVLGVVLAGVIAGIVIARPQFLKRLF